MGWVVVRSGNRETDGSINDEIAETDLESSLDELIDRQRRQSRSGSSTEWPQFDGGLPGDASSGASKEASPDYGRPNKPKGSPHGKGNGIYVLVVGIFVFIIWWFR